VRAARKLVWKTEDIAVGGVKLALGIARRAARPLLIGFVVHRALSTVENARLPACRTARMSPAERLEYENTRLMGADWRQQFEQDLIDAAKEVQDGFITGEFAMGRSVAQIICFINHEFMFILLDDYKEEKRKMSAAMLRRLEIEDWDKERMRHFYYGSYGLGPWYFDMEERLHNPYFIGARAWNGPIEGWVGKNKKYDDDIPISNVDWNSAALDMIEKKRGIRLTPAQVSGPLAGACMWSRVTYDTPSASRPSLSMSNLWPSHITRVWSALRYFPPFYYCLTVVFRSGHAALTDYCLTRSGYQHGHTP
jgi:hypothetical protein